MKSTSRSRQLLRLAALGALSAGLGTWAATGARVGWTQTSVVALQRDEITGIDYPVRHAAFVAGVEVPALGAVTAAVLAGLSWLPARRATAPLRS